MSLMLTEAARHEISLQLVFATNPEPTRLLSQKGNMTLTKKTHFKKSNLVLGVVKLQSKRSITGSEKEASVSKLSFRSHIKDAEK